MIAATSTPQRERAPGVREIARRGDAAAALDAVHGRLVPGGLACAAGGWTLTSPGRAARAARAVLGDRAFAAEHVSSTQHETPALRAVGLVALRVQPGPGACSQAAPGVGAALARSTAELRLGLALYLRDAAQAHLADRSAAGVPLLQHQLVKGALAEASLDLLLVEASLDVADLPVDGARRAHGRIGGASRTLVDLLGASGYLLEGPGGVASVSELVENVFITGARQEGRA